MESSPVPAQTSSESDIDDIEPEDFYSLWSGEKITPGYAVLNGGIFIGANDESSDSIWEEFSSAVQKGERAGITVCRENSVISVKNSTSGGEYRAEIKIKTADCDVVDERVFTVAPPQIWRVKNDEVYEYYLCDCLLYTRPCGDDKNDGEDQGIETAMDFQVYSAAADAGITFPFQKTFSSYSDFESYCEKYDRELSLGEMKKDMQDFDGEGGFNAHVVFLYADMAGSGEVDYRLINAVRSGGKLYIYVKKSVAVQKNSGVSKWQLVCTVPGEQLAEVSPDGINWVIFTETED